MEETEKENKEKTRKLVVPGEVLAEGEDYLPGDNTEKKEGSIISLRYGLYDESNNLVRVIPLSGIYEPRKGNVVIGRVEDMNLNGWFLDIGTATRAFLPLTEVPKYINKNSLEEFLDIGEMVVVKIEEVSKRGLLLTTKSRNLGNLEDGIVIEVNPHKVPRVIGKEGSMVKLIKDKTNCRIVVGQNGLIWIKSDSIKNEILAREAIEYVAEKSSISGLTDAVNKWFEDKGIVTEESSEEDNSEENEENEEEEIE